MNFTGKEPDEKQLFLQVAIPAPIPVFLQFQLPMIYKASYFTEWLLCNINLSSAFKLFYSLENARHMTHCNMYPPTLYCWLVSLCANFPKWWVIALAEIFLIQKFTNPTTEKSYVSNISYKAYMGITISCISAMNTIIIDLHLCMVTMCKYICTGVSKNYRLSVVHVHKESNLIWPDPFLAQAIYH